MISTMQSNIKKIVNLDNRGAGHNTRKIIQQVCFRTLCCFLFVRVVADLIDDWQAHVALRCLLYLHL
jgi:hypothetical protein